MLRTYARPLLGDRPIDTVTTADLHAVLSPIWTERHETASRLKQRLATIFDWAKGSGHSPHEDPVDGLKKALPLVKRPPEHHDALPWPEVPAFLADLARREGVSARCLEVTILAAARSLETRGAASSWTPGGGSAGARRGRSCAWCGGEEFRAPT